MSVSDYPKKQTPGYWLRRHAELQPNKVALWQEDRGLTYAELDRRVNRLANALKKRGLKSGDRIAALLYNRIELLEVFFAAAKLGAICVPLNYRLSVGELEQLLSDSGSSAFFFEKEWEETAALLAENLREPSLCVRLEGRHTGGPGYEELFSDVTDDQPEEALETGLESPALIMYTAGSTGTPKGVVLTHGNIYWQCQNALMMGILPSVVALAVLPFFHVGGLLGSAVPVLLIGGKLVVQAKFSPEGCLGAIAEHGVQGMVGVPAIYQFMAQCPEFEKTEFVEGSVFTSGGAPMPVSLIKTYDERGVTFRQGYGLTEAAAGVTFMYAEDALAKPGSVGRPCFYTQVLVVDDAGQPVAPGEQGEIVVNGPNVMKEYWNRPKASAETLRQGWLHTGDVGRFDEEGYLYITDRKKDMIISGGENIFPAEIEKLLSDHEAVKECTVLGAPDPKWGERVVAVVAPRQGAEVTLELVRDYLGEKLARYKLPRQLIVTDSLPRNAAGKVVKAELRAKLDLDDSLGG